MPRKGVMGCTECGRPDVQCYAHGRCRRCYHHWRNQINPMRPCPKCRRKFRGIAGICQSCLDNENALRKCDWAIRAVCKQCLREEWLYRDGLCGWCFTVALLPQGQHQGRRPARRKKPQITGPQQHIRQGVPLVDVAEKNEADRLARVAVYQEQVARTGELDYAEATRVLLNETGRMKKRNALLTFSDDDASMEDQDDEA